MLTEIQVNLSMLFPEPGVAEECPTTPTPFFLSGEKRQAFCAPTFIRPEKKVAKVNKEVNHVMLNEYLYATCSLKCHSTNTFKVQIFH